MLIDVLKSRVFEYQKGGETVKLSVVRYLLSAIKNKEIELRTSGDKITDEIVRKVIQKQIKQHKDSIEIYQKGNRQDLVEKEESELAVLEELTSL